MMAGSNAMGAGRAPAASAARAPGATSAQADEPVLKSANPSAPAATGAAPAADQNTVTGRHRGDEPRNDDGGQRFAGRSSDRFSDRFSDLLHAANDAAAPDADDADTKTASADAHGDEARPDAAAAPFAAVVDALVQMPGMAAMPLPPGMTLPATGSNGTRRSSESATADSSVDAVGLAQGNVDATASQGHASARAAALPDAPAAAPRATGNAIAAAATPDRAGRETSDGAGRDRRDANDAATASDPGRAAAKPEARADAAAAAGSRDRAPAASGSTGTAAPQAAWSSAMESAIGSDAAQTTVKLPVQSPSQWRQPLTEALGDKLQWQLGRNSEQATIRLDPPMLGRIEISIRHEAGALQVQLSATNNEVLRQLHGIGENLRHDLSQRQSGEVAVTVTDASRDGLRDTAREAAREGGTHGQGRGRERDAQGREKEPGRALAEAEAETRSTAAPFSFAREMT